MQMKAQLSKLFTRIDSEIENSGFISDESKSLLLDILKTEELTIEEKIAIYKVLQTNQKLAKSKADNTLMRFNGRSSSQFGQNEKAKNSKMTFLRLMSYFHKEIKLVAILFLAILIVVLCQVTTPRIQSICIDLIDDRNFSPLPKYLVLMLILFVILSLFNLFQGLLSAVLSQKIVKRMRQDLFNKLVNMPVAYFDNNSHGNIMSLMTNDIDNIANTLASGLSSLASGFLMIIGTLIMMFITSWQLAILSLAVIFLTVISTKLLSKAMHKFYKKRQILLGKLNGTVEEMLVANKTVTSYDLADKIIIEFEQTSTNLTKTGIIAEILGGSMGPVMNAISNIGFVIIAAFGGYFAISGAITVGVISAFIIYTKEFSRPINEIANLYGQLQNSLASAERVFKVFDSEEEDKSGDLIIDNGEGNIEFVNVNFSYDFLKPVLLDFSLEVKSGEKIALVGATGSGKTTVVNLLMRFYKSEGIFIDGKKINDIDIKSLRKNTAIVLQDTILFEDTIKNNLRYSNLKATDEEIVEACKICHCDNFIMSLKGGYEAMLIDGGSNLSQGQRQLLAIARAFIAKPLILILDEATSSVDTRTEKYIQDATHSLMANKTSLIIAHRLSTILDADKIVVMDKGRIVEVGNHKSLLKAKGRYYELYMSQFAGKTI